MQTRAINWLGLKSHLIASSGMWEAQELCVCETLDWWQKKKLLISLNAAEIPASTQKIIKSPC